MRIGYFLSCEEYSPAELVDQARRAEDAGFEALWISDHFHPWNDAQGESPFVWSMIGALSEACRLPVTTAVTCPTMRVNPVIVAQAAATSAVMLDGTGIRYPADVQLIPPLAPVTVPLPVTVTVTVCEDAPAANPALTV